VDLPRPLLHSDGFLRCAQALFAKFDFSLELLPLNTAFTRTGKIGMEGIGSVCSVNGHIGDIGSLDCSTTRRRGCGSGNREVLSRTCTLRYYWKYVHGGQW
jgi:hypothetical protein